MRRDDRVLELINLGKGLRDMRLCLGLTYEDIADFDVSAKHYQDIERGVVNPTYLTLIKIAQAFQCHVRDIV
jgi:transcriptional regulator with XRE-family HTH domain